MTATRAVEILMSEQKRIDLEYDTKENDERYEAYDMAIEKLIDEAIAHTIDRVLEIIDGCKFKYKEDEVAAWDGILWHNRALEQAKQAVLALKGGE